MVKVGLGEIGYVHYFVDLIGLTVFFGVGFNNSVISFFFSSLLFPKHPSCSLDYWRKTASYQSALPSSSNCCLQVHCSKSISDCIKVHKLLDKQQEKDSQHYLWDKLTERQLPTKDPDF